MQTTLAELIESVSFALINSRTPPTDLKVEIQRRLHEAQQMLMAQVDLPDFRVDTSLSAPSSQTDGIYKLPEDFYRILEDTVYTTSPDERQLTFYRPQDWVRSHEFQRAQTGDPRVYTIIGRKETTGRAQIQVYPVPTRDYTIKFSYYAMPQDLRDADPDASVIDPRFPAYARDALLSLTVLKFPQFIGADQVAIYRAELKSQMASIRRHTITAQGVDRRRRAYRGPRGYGGYGRTWHGSSLGGSLFL